MNFLYDLAKAVQLHEGFYPGSLSYRNNNPGNLRGKRGAFMQFPTYEEGLIALKYDLKMKIDGEAGSIQRFCKSTGIPYERVTFLDMISIYAPSADHNNPIQYCDVLVGQLPNYNLRPATPLFVMAALIRGEKATKAPEMTYEQKRDAAIRAKKWASPARNAMLMRLIQRLQVLMRLV